MVYLKFLTKDWQLPGIKMVYEEITTYFTFIILL